VMPTQGALSIERMCQLARVSRASFYRSLLEHRPKEEDMEVRSTIQQIALVHWRRYGYRRITAELRRHGLLLNYKRVAPSCAQTTCWRSSRGPLWPRMRSMISRCI
jgi:transposase InsO family protein